MQTPATRDLKKAPHEVTKYGTLAHGWPAQTNVASLGPDVPMHFTAFHPDYRMKDKDHTPLATLDRAWRIARKNGIRYAYTGNVRNPQGESTHCHECDAVLVRRDRYQLSGWGLSDDGRCVRCGAAWAGVVEGRPGQWGPRRLPVTLS